MNFFPQFNIDPISLIVIGLVGVTIFFLMRELLLWYWGTNRIIQLLEQIEENTRPTDEPTKK